MMSAEWSRFSAKVVNSKWFYALPYETRFDFRDVAVRTDMKSDLPAWAIELLDQNEGKP